MKKTFSLLLAAMLLFSFAFAVMAAAAPTAEKSAVPGREVVLGAIASLAYQPFGPQAEAARNIVIDYALDSDDVMILLDTQFIPFYGKNQWSTHLFAAYLAGNIEEQLEQNKKAYCTYDGLIFMLNTYDEIQKQEKGFKIPELDKMVELFKKDQLKQFVADAEAKILAKK